LAKELFHHQPSHLTAKGVHPKIARLKKMMQHLPLHASSVFSKTGWTKTPPEEVKQVVEQQT